MSVTEVNAKVNGKQYNLEKESETKFSRSIPAPNNSANYNVSITATDDSGNTVVVDSSDIRFKDTLMLKVRVSDGNTEDVRQKILTNELGNRMLDTVAPVYDRSKLSLYVFEAIGKTLSYDLGFADGDFISQMFPQTVTWGIRLWEDEYGITPDERKTIQQRRQSLMSIMYKNKPITPYRIRQIVYAYTGKESDIQENASTNTITINIHGYISNLSVLKEELDRKLPAHLNYVIRTAETESIASQSYSGFGLHEYEKINLEVMN
jgi:hypothetical protein